MKNIKPCDRCTRTNKGNNCRCGKWNEWFAIEWNIVCEPFRVLLLRKILREEKRNLHKSKAAP